MSKNTSEIGTLSAKNAKIIAIMKQCKEFLTDMMSEAKLSSDGAFCDAAALRGSTRQSNPAAITGRGRGRDSCRSEQILTAVNF